jgi:tetratricopeptide (TPR) repeat protein
MGSILESIDCVRKNTYDKYKASNVSTRQQHQRTNKHSRKERGRAVLELTEIHTIAQVEAEVNRLEMLEGLDSKTVLELIGEQLSKWELAVRQTSHYALAFRIGELLEKVNQYWLALSWYQWLAVEVEAEASSELMIRSTRAKGRMYIRLGLYEEALPLLQLVEEYLTMEESQDPYDLPILLQNIAIVYNHLEQFETALKYAQSALTSFSQLGDTNRVNVVEGMIGTYLMALKRFEASFEYLLRARDGLEAAKDHLNLARCWHNHAELMRDWGRPEEAIAAWRMSLEMKKRVQDSPGQVNTLVSITDYLIGQNEWHAALSYITQAFTICHQHRLYDKEIVCLERWSHILFALGRYAELEVCASRAMFLVKSCTAKQSVTSLLQKIADYCEQVGFEHLAKQFHINAVQILG